MTLRTDLNNELLKAFMSSNRQKVQKLLKNGADKKIIREYVNKVSGWHLTMSQDWMIKDFNI